MLESNKHIPFAIPLLVKEVFAKSKSWTEARGRLREVLPDLKKQSAAYAVSAAGYSREPAVPGSLEIYLDGGLDLFNENQSCRALSCRQEAARRLTRSIGLLADTIWLTDFISEKFIDFGRVTNRKLEAVLADTLVLLELYPLMSAGIIKFRSPWVAACSGCLEHFETEVDRISETILSEHSQEFSLEPHVAGGLSFRTGNLYDPPLYLRVMPREGGNSDAPKLEDLAYHAVHRAIRSALWTGRDAMVGSGAVFSNSSIGLAGLAYKEGIARSSAELRLLDERRNVNVPWVSSLDATQIVQLREEASSALPAFREMLAKQLSVPVREDGSSSNSIVEDLRQQTVEVRNELTDVRRSSARFWKGTFGLLSFGLSAYGAATHQVAATIGGLLPVISLIVSHKAGSERDATKAMRRPGYVLVKAQDILAHDHEV
ncbi:hypothetical protein AB4Y42_35015 [Paraburkholderia sp. EG286B]|uniref:hypothetical protein n=1 Tax=Paraburkholderia sp. EG286B TaxID=3237011 RepID=UPI0034D1C782